MSLSTELCREGHRLQPLSVLPPGAALPCELRAPCRDAGTEAIADNSVQSQGPQNRTKSPQTAHLISVLADIQNAVGLAPW